MAELKRIDTGAIRTTADVIDAQNQRLNDTLESCQQTVHSLEGTWTGTAAETTVAAFDGFAAKYFGEYREMLDSYVKFLKNVAGEGYEETEQQVTRKADQI